MIRALALATPSSSQIPMGKKSLQPVYIETLPQSQEVCFHVPFLSWYVLKVMQNARLPLDLTIYESGRTFSTRSPNFNSRRPATRPAVDSKLEWERRRVHATQRLSSRRPLLDCPSARIRSHTFALLYSNKRFSGRRKNNTTVLKTRDKKRSSSIVFNLGTRW